VLVAKRLTIVNKELMMLAVARPKPHSRPNEPTCGAPVARFTAWVGPFSRPLTGVVKPSSYIFRQHVHLVALGESANVVYAGRIKDFREDFFYLRK
jgi:hypothetical protein